MRLEERRQLGGHDGELAEEVKDTACTRKNRMLNDPQHPRKSFETDPSRCLLGPRTGDDRGERKAEVAADFAILATLLLQQAPCEEDQSCCHLYLLRKAGNQGSGQS